ncbi:Prolyl tripeptidyl peptidase precursor [Rubripirellula tenax]|uniref:Prolyl tripeptidyl peptidase n=1 Tax=Rubripirellula tenax TaxID=2528015 RepID=A0A5C6FCK6_9BACT|nr:prolyl oligopeptidase family serine peptidase [Rubripirellula tenax]TWU59443.1 Prolyl tripeptidyl peptidase precursor [Rubripirellula tenax]
MCSHRAAQAMILMALLCGFSFASAAMADGPPPTPRTINDRLTVRWTDDDHCWFSRETSDGDKEIVRVDAASGTMTIESAADLEASPKVPLGFQGGPAPHSGPSDDETEIEFVNRTEQPVQMFWISTSGERIAYAKIAAGKTHRQHTYAGHVWESIGDDRKYYGNIVADVPRTVVVIQQEFAIPETKSTKKKRRRKNDKDPDQPGWKELKAAVNTSDDPSVTIADPQRSPDGRVLAAWKKTTADPMPVYTIESSPKGGGRVRLSERGYRLPGDAMDQYELVMWDVHDHELIPAGIPVIDFGRPRIRWRGEHDLMIEKVDRGHQRFRLFVIDPIEHKVTTPIDETTDTFIWSRHGPSVATVTYMDDTDEVIFATEQRGYRHLYLVDLSEQTPMRAITAGDFLVRDLIHIDEQRRQLDLVVGEYHDDQDPYHRHLIRVGIDDGKVTNLTDGDGDHEFQFSPDRRYVIVNHSRVDSPPVHQLRRTDDGALLATLAEAKRVVPTDSTMSLPTRFVAKGRDGTTDIWGLICFPNGYDPNSKKRYPVIESIYAGPHDSHVPKRYRNAPWYSEMTSLGFIVVRIDGMGTANRSKAFHDVCWHNLKDAGFPDRIAWMRQAAKQHPAMDLSRVGIYGTSAGGQNACGALLFHGDFYKAAVASCGCHDNRMDKASWNEQWMGVPVGPHYGRSSNIDNAANLSGDLLLLVGELDENVPPESTLRLVDALIKADKRFDFLMIPGMGHSDGGTYGRKRTRDFFVEKLIEKSAAAITR